MRAIYFVFIYFGGVFISILKKWIIHKNPGYMKENFVICIETLHAGDVGDQENVSDISCLHVFSLHAVLSTSSTVAHGS